MIIKNIDNYAVHITTKKEYYSMCRFCFEKTHYRWVDKELEPTPQGECLSSIPNIHICFNNDAGTKRLIYLTFNTAKDEGYIIISYNEFMKKYNPIFLLSNTRKLIW